MERELTDAECDAILRKAYANPYSAGYAFKLIRAGWQAAIAAQPSRFTRCADIERQDMCANCGQHSSLHAEWNGLCAAQPERARAPVAWRIDGKHPNGSGHVGWWTDMRHEADEYAAKNVDGFVWRVVPLYAAPIATLPEQILASTPDEATNGPSQEGAAGSDATLPDGDTR